MVGPRRPQFVLFGSSIVQVALVSKVGVRFSQTFTLERKAVEVLDQIFRKDEAIQPSLVIVYFGVENMRNIAIHLKSLSEKTRIIFLIAPPVNEAQILQVLGVEDRKNEQCKKYADACVKLSHEMKIKAIDLCTAFKQQDDWLTTCFTDGIHLSPDGSKIVAKEILKVIMEADWKPSLDWESLPVEFA
ncbi:unnamed protein product [Lactuca virosa]|uniref:SGNH hydrolase-type esterase domain-containing protein n=1 Tax=Lactuca virosa TaxID=75947 RepID=A0AAU9ND54_9ASTR|nr:unnamed protein product [Lactuca virosa]